MALLLFTLAHPTGQDQTSIGPFTGPKNTLALAAQSTMPEISIAMVLPMCSSVPTCSAKTAESINPMKAQFILYKGTPTGLQSDFSWSSFGNKAETWFGFSAGAAGDVNGDGGDDIIVGAPKYRFDEKTVMGRVFVYLNTLTNNTSHQIFIPMIVKTQ